MFTNTNSEYRNNQLHAGENKRVTHNSRKQNEREKPEGKEKKESNHVPWVRESQLTWV